MIDPKLGITKKVTKKPTAKQWEEYNKASGATKSTSKKSNKKTK